MFERWKKPKVVSPTIRNCEHCGEVLMDDERLSCSKACNDSLIAWTEQRLAILEDRALEFGG